MRTILILLCLAVSGFGLSRLTDRQSAPMVKITKPAAPDGVLSVPYHLILSSEAAEIQISSNDRTPLATLSGSLLISSNSRAVSLNIRWKTPPLPGETRFAKLILDPPGKATITHVFDAPGDIDDILELP